MKNKFMNLNKKKIILKKLHKLVDTNIAIWYINNSLIINLTLIIIFLIEMLDDTRKSKRG